LRRLLEGLAKGEPDYSALDKDFGDSVRERLTEMKGDIGRFGTIQSMHFRDVDSMGGDTYEVAFSRGRAQVSVIMLPDGKILGIQYRPL